MVRRCLVDKINYLYFYPPSCELTLASISPTIGVMLDILISVRPAIVVGNDLRTKWGIGVYEGLNFDRNDKITFRFIVYLNLECSKSGLRNIYEFQKFHLVYFNHFRKSFFHS